MKFLVFGGGLGNQIFEYAFYRYLCNKFPNEKIYGFYKIRLSGHNGLEIDKRFRIKIPPATWYSNLIVYFLYAIKKINPSSGLFDLDIYDTNERAVLHNALKMNKRYIPQNKNWLPFNIDENTLSKQNKEILNQIRLTESCFIHVRRGDYITGKWKEHYIGTCPLDYYKKAIEDIKRINPNICFYCFSDDIQWVKNNISGLSKVKYVDWNKGENSFIDMFLMSQCKNGIMANSTFSYWAAILGEKKQNIYYPTKWINGRTPDIFFPHWHTY